jgi:hypothetical protein
MDTYYPLFCLITGRIGVDRLDHLSIINLFRLVILLIDLPAQQMQYIKLKRNKLKGEDDYEKISREGFCVSGHENFISVLACLDSIRMNHVSD